MARRSITLPDELHSNVARCGTTEQSYSEVVQNALALYVALYNRCRSEYDASIESVTAELQTEDLNLDERVTIVSVGDDGENGDDTDADRELAVVGLTIDSDAFEPADEIEYHNSATLIAGSH